MVLDDQGWALSALNALDGTMEVLTDGNSHPPIYQVNVLRPGDGFESVHLEKPVPQELLSSEKPLTLSFKARAASNRKIRTALQDKQAEPWASEVTLTPDWQEFRLPIKPRQAPAGPAVLAFQIGGKGGDIALTEIKLIRS